jgi:hypothetical protein
MGSDDRRRHLRRRIRRAATTWDSEPKPANTCAHILAGLNAMRVLEDKAERFMRHVLQYGPHAYTGDNWAASLIWYRRKGVNTHQTIKLFGVWIIETDETTSIQIGTKQLAFSAPVYNPESYNTLIKRDFTTYYGNNGNPPPDTIIYETSYDVTRRLALRQEIADEIMRWLRQQEF